MGYRCVCFAKYSQFTDSVLLHRRFTLRRRGIAVPRKSLARCNARHLRIKRLVQFIFVGAVYHNALANYAALLCRACLDEITCVAVRYLTLRTGCSRGRTPKVVRPQQRKNPLPFPVFRSGHMSAICARLSKGKGRFTRGWKPQVSTLLCARAASAQFRSLLKRHSPVRERSENHRVETAGVYPLARRRGCGEPPRQRLAPILYAQEAAKPQFTSCTDRNRVLK